MSSISIVRTRHRILADSRRVLAKPYLPGEEILLPGHSRAHLLMRRILAIPEARVAALNAEIVQRFAGRHRDFTAMLDRQFEAVANYLEDGDRVSRARRLLIGAFFTHEYSIEAAALFNPSIVPAPSQDGVETGSVRFVMSLRAVGEGHLSSIEFRSGTLDSEGGFAIDDVGLQVVGGRRSPPAYFYKPHFSAKLRELGAINEVSVAVLERLDARFTLEALETSLSTLEAHGPPAAVRFETVKMIRVLASSNYVTEFPANSQLSERVIFPAGPNETRGMEDARFVLFTERDGSTRYYATYTAYDGFSILPQLIETDDFVRFTISTLNGAAAQNKGMALFPRTIDGKHFMLSRKDRENLHLSSSDDVHQWDDVAELYRPHHPWELMQIGNCGSPIETEAGWLVLTHGVGPMRRYAIGALLLDLHDPHRVLGHLPEPLIEPTEDERTGYVPNVVYTCGAIVHAGRVVIPYGCSDCAVAVATVAVTDLLEALVSSSA
jgi:predicted GH43/DUF377 family glycosyl hydrolase